MLGDAIASQRPLAVNNSRSCCLFLVSNQTVYSSDPRHQQGSFFSTQLQLSGNVLILGPFSGNPGDGCHVVKISIDQQFVKDSVPPVWQPAAISHSELVSCSFLMFILNFGKSFSPLPSVCMQWVAAMWLDHLLFVLSLSSFYDLRPSLTAVSERRQRYNPGELPIYHRAA